MNLGGRLHRSLGIQRVRALLRRCKLGYWVSALLILLPVASGAGNEDTDRPIDVKAAQSLLYAKDLASLDRSFRGLARTDPALVAIYRTRRLRLNPVPAEERRWLRAMPRTARDLRWIYALTYADEIKDDPLVTDVVYEMFGTASSLVQKHGRLHREFIELCTFTTGELAEAAWPMFDWLLEHDPAKTVAALRRLPAETRKRLCKGTDPIDLSEQEAVRECRSEL